MTGYVSRENACYQKKTKRPWDITECAKNETFVFPKNQDENKFIYEKFVAQSEKSFWINARVFGKGKLCNKDYDPVLYHNFADGFPNAECVQMPIGLNGKWEAKDCTVTSFYICKYG